MAFGRGQIVLGGLLRGGLLVVVVEELAEHVARILGQAGIVGERTDATDKPSRSRPSGVAEGPVPGSVRRGRFQSRCSSL